MILFDGLCNLCSSSVQFVIKNDPDKKFKLGSLQSDEGKRVLQKFNIDPYNYDTFLLIEHDKIYSRSTAALKVSRNLKGWWPILSIFLIVPKFIRDFIYNFIAKNRYKWFGKKNECWVPDISLRDRFIEKF